jgi:RNA polymerase sigma factor (TIGR02999 family)
MSARARSDNEVTQLLRLATRDQAAHERLFTLVKGQLEQRARSLLRRELCPHSLQTAILVDDAFVALLGGANLLCENRAHFYRLASRVMEQVLVKYARSRRRLKRNRGKRAVALEAVPEPADRRAADSDAVLAVHAALQRLQADYPQSAEIVRLRFFGGHTEEEVAAVLGLSRDQVKRRWQTARALLASFLTAEEDTHEP